MGYNSVELTWQDDAHRPSLEQAQELARTLTTNPMAILTELKQYEQDMERHCQNGLLTHENARDYVQQNRQHNPIFLLGECDAGHCGLNRNQNNSRPFYEHTVVSYLNRYKDQPRINLVAFASGGLFQELIILARACTLHHVNNITIHLIDTSYQVVIEALLAAQAGDRIVNIARYNEYDFSEYSIKRESDHSRRADCEKFLIIKQEQFRQFTAMAQLLSGGSARVFLHASASDYKAFCNENSDMKADVISAMDFEPGYAYISAIKDYYALMYHTLKNGGVSILADNQTAPQKLHWIDYKRHTLPNAICAFKWNLCETTLKHVVPMTRETIDRHLDGLHKHNLAFVSVHTKRAECCPEFLADVDEIDFMSDADLSWLDHNSFIAHSFEFEKTPPSQQLWSVGALVANQVSTLCKRQHC